MTTHESAHGTIEINFKTENSYRNFASNWSACNANLNVQGEIKRPTPTGGKTYQFHFDFECDSGSALENFKLAYDKTFERQIVFPLRSFDGFVNQTRRSLEIDNVDFTAELLHSGPRPIDHLESIRRADLFFDDIPVNGTPVEEGDPYQDSDGIVEFIVAGQLADDPIVSGKLQELKKTLVTLQSIATKKVFQIAEDKQDNKLRTDPVIWHAVMSKLPLMGPGRVKDLEFRRLSEGIQISTDFLEAIVEGAVSEGAALDSFKTWLGKQGNEIGAHIEEGQKPYSDATAGVTSEAFELGDGGEAVFTPKLKMHVITFNSKNFEFSSSCGSANKVEVNFKYSYFVQLFNYEALEDDDVREKFEEFLRSKLKQDIEEADEFFDDDFDIDNGPLALPAAP